MSEQDKPRLAEVLGVEVGERFRIGDIGCDFWIEAEGWPNSELFDRNASAKWVVNAINHPESIIRAPRLTEAELAIMRDTGARWVTRDDNTLCPDVSLWREEPVKIGRIYGGNATPLAIVSNELFPSVRPGDCIEAEVTGE